MGEWKEYKLGDVALTVTSGGTPKSSEPSFYNGNIPWLNTKEINFNRINKTEKYITEKGLQFSSAKWIPKYSIIVAMYGATAGKVAYSLIDLTTNQACCNIVIDNKKAVALYVYYYLQFSYNDLKNLACGAAQQNLNINVISNYSIILPPLSEQKRIASILGSLDDKIDLLHRENETLEAMAETLFRKWFIEDAKEICKTCKISDVIDFNPHRKLFKGTNSLFLEMTNLNTSTYCPKAWYNKEFTSGTKFINGDTLLARITPCLENGKTAYIDILKEKQVGWGSTEFIVMRPKLGLHPFFAYILAKYQDFRDFAESCMSGSSGRQRVDIENLKNYDFRIPNKRIIDMFNDSIIPIISKMKNNNNEIFSLRKMRDVLLHKLMLNEIK